MTSTLGINGNRGMRTKWTFFLLTKQRNLSPQTNRMKMGNVDAVRGQFTDLSPITAERMFLVKKEKTKERNEHSLRDGF